MISLQLLSSLDFSPPSVPFTLLAALLRSNRGAQNEGSLNLSDAASTNRLSCCCVRQQCTVAWDSFSVYMSPSTTTMAA